MPRRDGMGPMGQGTMTGRGFGVCTEPSVGGNPTGVGFGCRQAVGQGRGRGRGMGVYGEMESSKTQKQLLEEQKDLLQNRLEAIDEKLEKL